MKEEEEEEDAETVGSKAGKGSVDIVRLCGGSVGNVVILVGVEDTKM